MKDTYSHTKFHQKVYNKSGPMDVYMKFGPVSLFHHFTWWDDRWTSQQYQIS